MTRNICRALSPLTVAVLLPFGLWILGGWIADKRGQRRAVTMLKEQRKAIDSKGV